MPIRKYNRIFILLNGINEGLSGNINGSCDIEIIDGRGRLYGYFGGIGRLKEKPRTLYLLCCDSDRSIAIPAGKLEDKGTNAVLEKHFDPDDVFGSGKSIEDINAAAVWCETESPVRAVLEGYVSQKVNWMHKLQVFGSDKLYFADSDKTEIQHIENLSFNHTAEKLESKIMEYKNRELNVENDSEEEYKENAYASSKENPEKPELQAAETIIQEKPSPHDTFRAIAERFKRELDMLDEIGLLDKSLMSGLEDYKIKEEKGKKQTKLKKSLHTSESNAEQKNAIESEQDKLFVKKDRLDIGGGTIWVRTDYREMYLIPSAINDLRKPFVQYGARKGRHLIAGKNGDEYYIGVPGSEEQRDSAEKNGFYDFLPVEENGKNGYWIKEL